jgi:hypothetical protein
MPNLYNASSFRKPLPVTPSLSDKETQLFKNRVNASVQAGTPAGRAKANLKRLDEQIAALKKNLQTSLTRLSEITKILGKPPLEVLWGVFMVNRYYIPWLPDGKDLATPTEAKKVKQDLIASIAETRENIRKLEGALSSSSKQQEQQQKNGNKGKKEDVSGGPPSSDGGPAGPTGIEYNVGSVKEAYFTGKQDTAETAKLFAGNTPAKVAEAMDLWKAGSASKGMIVTHTPLNGQWIDGNSGNWAVPGDTSSIRRSGFQFLYNPTTIGMTYGGVPPVDITVATSGQEDYTLQAPSLYQSAINFEILINRMHDLKYIEEKGVLKGNLKASDLYVGNIPDTKTLSKIYNKGTMYDIEFLLKTMFAVDPFPSLLRGRTTDIGFLGPSPVQLHLGKKLRYVVMVDSITVDHVIFNNQMVPMFSTVRISTRRIPDYRPGKVSNAS